MKSTFKLSLAAVLVSTAMAANAGISIVDNEEGNFSIGGDVEFDFNFQDRESNNNTKEFDQSGRILLEFAGERYTDTGHVFQFKAQPLMETSGNIALDDAWFGFGAKDGWNIRMGRFESMDMFPVGQDTFLEYSGDTANDLYTDGSAYVYQMKEARGRGGEGQIMYSQSFDNLYVEVAGMLGKRDVLFANKSYHGETIEEKNVKDSFLVRPVIGYKMGNFGVAVSMETNLVSNAVVVEGRNGQDVDISDRTGYGLTANYATGDLSVNLNAAYLDAVDETNTTLGANVLWKGFGLGYVHAMNNYESKELKDYYDGDVEVGTWYASYEFANVLAVEDFSIYLGAYHTTVDEKGTNTGGASDMFSEDADTGMRVRFKYFF